MINLLHIPEGVRDIYGSECINKSEFENNIKTCMHAYGFSDVVTPTFEYFDIFNKERGTVPSKDMYKFFDREGNTLVLRPDITPSLARVTAKYYKDCVMPVRLCYRAKQYINHSSLQGKLKETTQLGAELYNDDSVYADLEIILLTIESIKSCGVKDFMLEIGIADFYKGIVEEAKFTEEEELTLKELLEQKNIFGIDDFVAKCDASDDIKLVLSKLAVLYGSVDVLNETKAMNLSEKSINAVDRLIKLNDLIKEYGYEKYVSYDLSMLSKFSYYTGVFFRAITYGSGEPIAYGGRYDNLVKQFGLDVPAIGMAITLDYLMLGLDREKLLPKKVRKCSVIFYDEAHGAAAIKKAKELRESGKDVRMIHDESRVRLNQVKSYFDNKTEANAFTKELETFDIEEIIELED